MAGNEDRQCPQFGTLEGVCGCPGFWQFDNHTQGNNRAPSLQKVSNARYGSRALRSQCSSSVNSIPTPDRAKSQTMTPAPPGPPRETCFFWYHGACRRGDQCDRSHEVHPTWPISPPPGFRHFQPCTLPFCPLRSDLEAATMSQEYQSHRRSINGQTNGASFSRATTAGESFRDFIGCDITGTDIHEAGDDLSSIVKPRVHNGDEEGAGAVSEVHVEQSQGKNESDEPDYVDLSISSPPTPVVQEGILSSISHPGTCRSVRRHLPITTSLESSSKHAKVEQGSFSDRKDVIPILERPRIMSRWDIKPSSLALDGQDSEVESTYFTPTHDFPDPKFGANDNSSTTDSKPFNPHKEPRSMVSLPQICFFYYHQGYCRTKRGRRCGYLHNTNTSQQTVDLPYGIDPHNPDCSLPLCPLNFRALGRTNQESASLQTRVNHRVKHELLRPPRINKRPSRIEAVAVRGRLNRGRMVQSLPRWKGMGRRGSKEQAAQCEGQNEHLLLKSRCQRCSNDERQCNCQGPDRRCEPAGIDAESRINQIESNIIAISFDEQAASAEQLPDGNQRPDMDSDLVRRLFEEIK